MSTATATVTNRGQVTLPKVVREALGESKAIEFTVVGNVIVINPIQNMAGSLAQYAKKDLPDKSFKEIREEAWAEAANAKTS